MSALGGWGELYHYSMFAQLEFYWNVHSSYILIASNGSPIQNLVHTNSYLRQKYSEFEMHEKMKKSGLSKCKIKTLKCFLV